MSSDGSITRWIKQLQQGNRESVQKLWERYFSKLVRLARSKLRGLPPRLAGSEDLALSAFNSFCLAAEQRRFPKLETSDDLWQILVMLTRNKAGNLRLFHEREKRDHRRERHLDELVGDNDDVHAFSDLIESSEPDPRFVVEFTEQYQKRLQALPDEQFRRIVVWKMEGYTNEEIAKKFDPPISVSTVERRLKLIRKSWQQELESNVHW